MKKVIIKSIICTMLLIIAIYLTLFIILHIFFPRSLVKINDNIQNKNATIFYSEKVYKKTQDIVDLNELVIYVIKYNNEEKIINYCGELILNENYEDLLSRMDDGVTHSNYIVDNYIKALFSRGDNSISIECAFKYTKSYTEFINPIRSIIYLYFKQKEYLSIIYKKLNELKEKTIDEKELQLIDDDLISIKKQLDSFKE